MNNLLRSEDNEIIDRQITSIDTLCNILNELNKFNEFPENIGDITDSDQQGKDYAKIAETLKAINEDISRLKVLCEQLKVIDIDYRGSKLN